MSSAFKKYDNRNRESDESDSEDEYESSSNDDSGSEYEDEDSSEYEESSNESSPRAKQPAAPADWRQMLAAGDDDDDEDKGSNGSWDEEEDDGDWDEGWSTPQTASVLAPINTSFSPKKMKESAETSKANLLILNAENLEHMVSQHKRSLQEMSTRLSKQAL